MRIKFALISNISLTVLISINVTAQVMKGSSQGPNRRALFDLQQERITILGATGYKDLEIPKVYLPKLNELIAGRSQGVQIVMSKSDETWKAYASLMVYTNAGYCPEIPIPKGLYVWINEVN